MKQLLVGMADDLRRESCRVVSIVWLHSITLPWVSRLKYMAGEFSYRSVYRSLSSSSSRLILRNCSLTWVSSLSSQPELALGADLVGDVGEMAAEMVDLWLTSRSEHRR